MKSLSALAFAALLVLSLGAVPAAGATTAPPDASVQHSTADPATAPDDTVQAGSSPSPSMSTAPAASTQEVDSDDDPSTEGTVGYVEGVRYDDSLPVDNRSSAVVEEDELEAVVHRSMARVEVIRNETFEEDVSVDVVSREEFRADQGTLFAEENGNDRLFDAVLLEGLFMLERDAPVEEATETLYGESVAGYYDSETDEIVVVAEDAEQLELNERTLGHELVHALQDQRFDLSGYDRETTDGDTAVNGLIEGDASWVEAEYDRRCADEWDCAPAVEQTPDVDGLNWGLYFSIYQPYDDGPDYVEHLRQESGDSWGAVDAAYDDPPESSSEVIRPGDDRDPVDVEVEDRSNDEWRPLEADGEVATDRLGEATMVAMFADGAMSQGEPSVIERDEFVRGAATGEPDLNYDQPMTDGWAGDEFVVYAGEDASREESGFVWETRWTDADEAVAFAEGYLEELENHDAESVEDRRDTYEIDGEFPGAYALEVDGDTVTIVRAPSVDALPEIRDGAAPEGEDTLEVDDDGASDGADETSEDDDGGGIADEIPGFGPLGALLTVAATVALAIRRGGGANAGE
ncbi:Hvo_1808 family surface protein [Natrialbaceae archaeon GCM10025810]|uniref:Hvo_1808 family surface protein n=1 Tax=Halovalidus salilacus TaxID=3075124 RepID=UPI0036236D42